MIVPLLVVGGLVVGALLFGKKGAETQQPTQAGKQFVLRYATTRLISDTDLSFIQRAMGPALDKMGVDLQGIAITGPQEFSANVSARDGYVVPPIGSVGVMGSNPNDAVTIQLIAADKVS